MTPRLHARYLDYRARHAYFARGDAQQMSATAFAAADAELSALEALAEDERSDEDEARLAELRIELHLD